ncbi:hypothetical protein DL93DRAFT_2080788 [Clavulina sp. PMI_390]|nr:hypothetical protein DL93DRAFT_2080788 [Clavulina sp. PMI_390]
MKLIIAGASGYVSTELIRQALERSDITSIIALARKPISAPSGVSNASKLKSVVLSDYDSYPDEVNKEFAGADACIWTVAIPPFLHQSMPFDEVVRVCQTCTIAGLNAMVEAQPSTPFRFLYMSNALAERDKSKTPKLLPEYSWLRGETENQVLQFASEHPGVEVSIVKSGYITAPDHPAPPVAATGGSTIEVSEIATAMLQQVVTGFDKEPLMNDDLLAIVRRVKQ